VKQKLEEREPAANVFSRLLPYTFFEAARSLDQVSFGCQEETRSESEAGILMDIEIFPHPPV
jgi:hypothetical protein